MPRIFICYRRDDSAGHAGRLRDSLSARLGRTEVFRDLDTIGPGDDFAQAMSRAIASCDVFLAVIGPHWLTASAPDGRRRIEAPDDHVRREVIEALDRRVRIVPVLVGGAGMPVRKDLPEPLAPLAQRNAITLNDEGWESDIERLADAIGPSPGPGPLASVTRSLHDRRVRLLAVIAAAVLVVIVAARSFDRGVKVPPQEAPAPAAGASATAPLPSSTAQGRARDGEAARPTLPAGGDAELGQTVVEILEADVSPRGAGATLAVRFRVTNNALYAVLYTDRQLRLLTPGGEPLSPAEPLSHLVAGESAKDGAVAFDLPSRDIPDAVLRITLSEETAEVPLDLRGRAGLTARAARDARRAGRTTTQAAFDRQRAEMPFGEVTCALQSATVRAYAHKLTLTLRVRVHNRSRYDVGFGDSQFRLLFDEMAHPPADPFSKLVRADGSAEADVVFDVPAGTADATLRVRFGETVTELPLHLASASRAVS